MKSREYINFKALIAKHICDDVLQGDDGYYIWWPQEGFGAYTAADLEMIAKLLNEANRKWDNEVKEYFEIH